MLQTSMHISTHKSFEDIRSYSFNANPVKVRNSINIPMYNQQLMNLNRIFYSQTTTFDLYHFHN